MQAERWGRQLGRDNLRVVVLGPGESQKADFEKRKQITSRLRDHGYCLAELGEDFLGCPPEPLHIALLSALDTIDLLIVLNTGAASLAELSVISLDLAAREKTIVWWPARFDEGRRTIPTDVVGTFSNNVFGKREFSECQLVEEVIEEADRFCMNHAQREGRLVSFGLIPPGLF